MPDQNPVQSMMEAISEVAEFGANKRQEIAETYAMAHGGDKKKKKKVMAMEDAVDPTEDIVVEFLEGFLGDSINEATTEEDQNEAILEAVASLNNLCAVVNEYFETTEAYGYAVESLHQEG